MPKTAPLIFFAIIVLFSACKQSSFLKQRYTHYSHSKATASDVEKNRKTNVALNLQSLAMQAKVEDGRIPQQKKPKRSEAFTPATHCSMPVHRNQHDIDLTVSAEYMTKNTGASSLGLKKVKLLPIKILSSLDDRAERIPVITPVLKIVFLVLLIVLVALVIFLVMIL
jgi:hypothetical protein